MKASVIGAQVDALLAVLDDDIEHTEATVKQLDTLRTLLIKRDDKALEELLRELRDRGQTQQARDRRRQVLRQDLATALGYQAKSLTLSALQEVLSEPQRTAVADRQSQLKARIIELKREYRLTHALIVDCARFNRSLMRVFFGAESDRRTTYSATGRAKHQTNMTLVNLHY